MNRKRILCAATALGGFAAFAMLSGVPNAKADELSDLRANNELLQQKLDQVAQIGNVGPSRVFSTDQQAMTAAATAGSFPRSFLIPGTDTSIRVGGNITFIANYIMEGGSASGGGSATTWNTTLGANGGTGGIPITGPTSARSSNLWGESLRQSQLSVETRTPTPFGEARTYMSFDWAAGSDTYVPAGGAPGEISDNLSPRLKYAYGTLGGWLAGQANSNFEDPDANGETLDFGGNVGEPGRVRTAQLRYTMPLTWAWGGALSFSAENPEVEVRTPFGVCGSDASANSACASPGIGNAAGGAVGADINVLPGKPASPDFVMALYIPQPWGHFDLSGIVRPGLEIADGAFLNRDYVGGGVHLGFDIKPGWFTPKDDIIFHFVAGEGLGGYLNDSTNAALQTNYTHSTTAAVGLPGTTCASIPPVGAGVGMPASCIISGMIPEYGGEIGYQHWWSDTLRSNINYGINQVNGLSGAIFDNATAAGSPNHRLQTAHANLIWNPVSFVTIGVEYMFGRRTVAFEEGGLNTSNNLQALIGKFDVAF